MFNGIIEKCYSYKMIELGGWMDDLQFFMSFLTVFQSYQDDVRVLNERLVPWNLVYGGKISSRARTWDR